MISLLITTALCAAEPDHQIWVDRVNNRRFPATLMWVDGQYALLKKPDGRTRRVKLSHMNTGSLLQIIAWYKSFEDAATRPQKPKPIVSPKPRKPT